MTEQIKTMPLRPGQKLVINGAVVRMGSDGSSLELDLKTPVLTEDELLSEDEATTQGGARKSAHHHAMRRSRPAV